MKWEYLILVLEADAEREMDFLLEFRDWKSGVPRYAVESLIPRLNALGEDGWELIRIEAVKQGEKGDIMISDSAGYSWAKQYFCAFKRPKAPASP